MWSTNSMHLFFFLKSFKNLVVVFFFWYTVRSPLGSINCDHLFTGKWACESLYGQSHLSSARGGATAAWGGTTELMGTLLLTLLSWKATRDAKRNTERNTGRQKRQDKRRRQGTGGQWGGGEKQQHETHTKKSRGSKKANRWKVGCIWTWNRDITSFRIKRKVFEGIDASRLSDAIRWQCCSIVCWCVSQQHQVEDKSGLCVFQAGKRI